MPDPKTIEIKDYNYPLPNDRVASHPLAERDRCKLLVRGADGAISDHRFDQLPGLLPPGSMLIYNDTRVINARLRFRKPGDNGAMIEIFCLEPAEPADYAQNFASDSSCAWHCFVGNSKRWKGGELIMRVRVGERDVDLRVERVAREGNASIARFAWDASGVTFAQLIEAAGEIPIPPYLNRSTEASDTSDYQTVYSHIDGSVAAPTAGLHFTPEVLEAIDQAGIGRRQLTLHVGAGTFQPVKSDHIGAHQMHSEFIAVDRDLIAELAETERAVVAVGTTSVRTLESLYHAGVDIIRGEWNGEVRQWSPYRDLASWPSTRDALNALVEYLDSRDMQKFVASTRIIIAPGYRFRVVDAMVTNFHQPQSTLLLLVSAFTGGDWRAMYDHALASDYRFLSYGDASLLFNSEATKAPHASNGPQTPNLPNN